jgi:hypothetical protein
MVPAQRGAISRRAFASGLGSLAAILPAVCSAQSLPGRAGWEPWKKIPSIVVLSAADDSRLSSLHEAVGFWNAVFVNLGSPFRLGRVSHSAEMIPRDELRRAWTVGSFEAIDRVSKVNGDIFVALTDSAGRPLTLRSPWGRKALVVIGGDLASLAPHPNGIQNVVAHELGHAIGLDHNNDTTALMCGGGARCNSKHARGGFLPLTRNDKLRLLEMYPPDWQEELP